MSSTTIQVRIKLDLLDEILDYILQLEQWEGEGGLYHNIPFDKWEREDLLPLHPGDELRVLKAHVERDGNDLYYLAELEKISDS